MTSGTARIPRLTVNGTLIAAVTCTATVGGALAGYDPKFGVALAALVLVVALTVCAPVAHLIVFIAITAMVPPEIQNRLGILGGTDAPGLLASDLLLAAGLTRAVLVLLGRQLERRELVTAGLAVALLVVTAAQAYHGISRGIGFSEVAAEGRVIFYLAGSVLLAMPLLVDEKSRRRLLGGLVILGLAIGLWGILQWVLGLRFTGAEEALEGAATRFLTAGRTVGQYAFGVAAIIALAVWTSGAVRLFAARMALIAVVGLNIVALLFTFERTFWAVTAIGIAFVTVQSRGVQRAKLVIATPAVLALLYLALLTFAPAELHGAGERLLSIGNYQNDESATYRVEESRRILTEIGGRPLHGSGLGASIVIGRPGTTVIPKPRRYAENGYLWITWKLGIPGALLLLTLIGLAVVRRGHPDEQDRLAEAARRGAQAGLLALAAATVTFPSFNAIAITPAMGLMLALCAMPRTYGRASPVQPPAALAKV